MLPGDDNGYGPSVVGLNAGIRVFVILESYYRSSFKWRQDQRRQAVKMTLEFNYSLDLLKYSTI